MSKHDVAKPDPKGKPRDFSKRMKWLTEACADPNISDEEFRFMFALAGKHLSNDTDWCDPKDDTVGKSCNKSGRTIRRLAARLKAKGFIRKRKQLGASHYSFPGLNEDRPHMAGVNETRPATYDQKTGHAWPEDRPPVGRTYPPIYPPINPPIGEEASPSPRNEASASSNGCQSSLGSQTPKALLTPYPPGSARPPFPPLGRHMGKTNLSKEEQAAAAVETALARQTIYSELLEWSGLESALSDATAAELRRKGSGAELIVNRYKQRMAV